MSKKAMFTSKLGAMSPTYLENMQDYFEPVKYLSPVNYSNVSRYKNVRTIRDDETSKIHHESWKVQGIPLSNDDDSYFTVTLETENRLDLIAYNYYGSARYWWIVALANNIIDPFDVPVGKRLRIPPMLTLYKVGGVLGG